MIEYITGAIDRLSPTDVTVSAGAIGYLVNISLNTYTALEGKSECRLWTHLRIQEDAWTLYGFATAEDTGGNIKGNTVDLYYNTESLCRNFGRRSVTIYVLN